MIEDQLTKLEDKMILLQIALHSNECDKMYGWREALSIHISEMRDILSGIQEKVVSKRQEDWASLS